MPRSNTGRRRLKGTDVLVVKPLFDELSALEIVNFNIRDPVAATSTSNAGLMIVCLTLCFCR